MGLMHFMNYYDISGKTYRNSRIDLVKSILDFGGRYPRSPLYERLFNTDDMVADALERVTDRATEG